MDMSADISFMRNCYGGKTLCDLIGIDVTLLVIIVLASLL